MTSTNVLSIGAIVAIVSGLFAVAVVARAAGRAEPPVRCAYQAFGLGLVLAVVGLGGTAAWAVSGGGLHEDFQLAPFAIGLAVSAIVMLAGLLQLSGIAEPPGSRMRHVVEGLLVAACSIYAVWALFVQPATVTYLGMTLSSAVKTVGLLALAPGVFVLAVAGTVGWRARQSRPGPGAAAAALACTVVTGGTLLVVVGIAPGPLAITAGALYGGGLCLTAFAVRPAHRFAAAAATAAVPPVRDGTLLAWLPVSIAIASCLVRLATIGSLDNVSVVTAAVIGAALGGRQTLAMRDVKAYADQLARREALFRELAHTDPLTGLGNRRAFQHVLEQQAMCGSPSVLLSIDLDGFKNINDLRGHDAGDAVLVEVGRRIRTSLRPGDVAARLGGDEFAVLLSLGQDEAVAAAGRLCTVLAAPYRVSGSTDVSGSVVILSASIGLAQCDAAADVADLLRNADLALRFAKLRGKNRIEGYDATYAQWLRRRTTIEAELRGAIARAELSVVYQPVVSLPSGAIVGTEALMRWHHPVLGAVSPVEFIPVAEESGQINELGRWVLQEACRQLSRWLFDGFDLWMAVNISVRELHHPEYVARVGEVLRAHRVPPAQVVLEVTEHAVAVDIEELATRLGALRDTGVRIALDDFGAGYSSLGQLRQVPVDILKIDQSIVAEPAAKPQHPIGPLVDVVARLGERLGLDVIAEGVETPAQRSVVELAGCGFAQGELFGRPMPAERFEAALAADLAVHTPRVSGQGAPVAVASVAAASVAGASVAGASVAGASVAAVSVAGASVAAASGGVRPTPGGARLDVR